MVSHTLELAQGDSIQVLMLNEYLAFLFSKHISKFIFIGAFLVWIAYLWLLASFLEQIKASHLLSSEGHAERRSHLTEWNSAHLYVLFANILTLKMSELNRLFLSSAGEHHHTFELLNVGLS